MIFIGGTGPLEQPLADSQNVAVLDCGLINLNAFEFFALANDFYFLLVAHLGHAAGLGDRDPHGHAIRNRIGSRTGDLSADVEHVVLGGRDVDLVARLDERVLVAQDGGFLALAEMGDDIYTLRSDDARTWTCELDEPVFPISTIEGADRVHTFAAGTDGDNINLMIEALFTSPDGQVTSNIWMAHVVGL